MGQAIIVKADIMASAPDKDAIKFNLIEINLRLVNVSRHLELTNKLNGFKVRATHMGNSCYRYDDKVYVVSSTSQSWEYSFAKDTSGVPKHRNQVHNKIKAGNLMVSPYAMWKIQLMNLTNKIPFSDLAMYKDEVDLELVGKGNYVTRGAHIPDLDVEKYYKSDYDNFFIENEIYEQYEA